MVNLLLLRLDFPIVWAFVVWENRKKQSRQIKTAHLIDYETILYIVMNYSILLSLVKSSKPWGKVDAISQVNGRRIPNRTSIPRYTKIWGQGLISLINFSCCFKFKLLVISRDLVFLMFRNLITLFFRSEIVDSKPLHWRKSKTKYKYKSSLKPKKSSLYVFALIFLSPLYILRSIFNSFFLQH